MPRGSIHARIVRVAVIVVSIAMAIYHMSAIAFGTPEALQFRGTHLLFALVLVFLLYRLTAQKDDQPVSDDQRRTDDRLPTVFDYALLVIGALPILHLFFNY